MKEIIVSMFFTVVSPTHGIMWDIGIFSSYSACQKYVSALKNAVLMVEKDVSITSQCSQEI